MFGLLGSITHNIEPEPPFFTPTPDILNKKKLGTKKRFFLKTFASSS